MSETLDTAIARLKEKVQPGEMDFSVALHVRDEGVIRLDETGVSESDEEAEADLTLVADAETFAGIMDGSVNPAGAAMSGKVEVRGDYSYAMRLGSVLL
ncbi:SCP2 sterol-binding domain-containing protein [Oceanibium sediminis]|uniref:SCP2 sterol-binding domain-containing protein n=1 Tax=Oceanibium sediminis TaxID=2026339 RepID=UPI000DD32EF7|nr:SCP2 sterol-binding domain-containing protein [Oceanibium sediminis]